MWLEITSADGNRCWPLSWFYRKAGHSSGSTADSEVHALVGAGDSGLEKEVIPALEQPERNLRRSVKLMEMKTTLDALPQSSGDIVPV